MPLYNIFNARMQKVDWVDAVGDDDALRHAKRKYPGAAVERVLTAYEQRQKDYRDSVALWEAMNPEYQR